MSNLPDGYTECLECGEFNGSHTVECGMNNRKPMTIDELLNYMEINGNMPVNNLI